MSERYPHITWVERICQVENITDVATVQYSKLKTLNNSNSTVEPTTVLDCISDLVHDGYQPYYIKQIKQLGVERFMELANKARAGSNTPQLLFSWMLKNNKIIN